MSDKINEDWTIDFSSKWYNGLLEKIRENMPVKNYVFSMNINNAGYIPYENLYYFFLADSEGYLHYYQDLISWISWI